MDARQELINSIEKLHTTELGKIRIIKGLHLNDDIEPVAYCKSLIENECNIQKHGKNYYCRFKNTVITVNSSSFTIITAHIQKEA